MKIQKHRGRFIAYRNGKAIAIAATRHAAFMAGLMKITGLNQ